MSVNHSLVRYPRIWAAATGLFGLFGAYGVLVGVFGASFWPDRLSASDRVIALPLALLIAFALACVVWYHLAHRLPAWPIAGGATKDGSLPRQIRIALMVLVAYIGLVVGEGVTVLLYGSESPFREVFDGIGSYEPVLPLWTWPLVFAAAGGVMHWLCWSAIYQAKTGGMGGAAT